MGNIIKFGNKEPSIHPDAFVFPQALIIGDVVIDSGASIWPGVILRADEGRINIGKDAVVLDQAFIEAPAGSDVKIGEEALISHGAMIHGAIIEKAVLVGIGSIILDRAHVASESIISAGTLIPPRMEIPHRSLVQGSPGEIRRTIDDDAVSKIRNNHRSAWSKAQAYRGINLGGATTSSYTPPPAAPPHQDQTSYEASPEPDHSAPPERPQPEPVKVNVERVDEMFDEKPAKLQKKLKQKFQKVDFEMD